MAICTSAEHCALRQAIGMKAALDVWKSFYCEGAFQRCERHKLATSGVDVPARLLPNGRLLEGLESMIVAASKPK